MVESQMVLLVLLITWVAIYLLSLVFPLDRYGFKVTPIYIMYKTERFNSFLSRIAEKNKKIWLHHHIIRSVAMWIGWVYLLR